MPWVKLDDQFPEHPKVVEAGPLAGWLYVCGLAYCQRQLTDGFIPTAQLRRLLPTGAVGKLADRLVAVRLWEEAGGGFQVHDYLKYNATREQTLALRRQRASAGRKGGWQKAGNVLAERQASATTPEPIPIPDPSHEASTQSDDLRTKETARAPGTAVERAGALAVPKPGQAPGSPQTAVLAAFASATGYEAPTTVSARKKWIEPVSELVHAGVTADEVPCLVAAFEDQNTVPVTLQGIANQLPQLRSPRPLRPRNGHGPASRLEQTAANWQELEEESGDVRAGGAHREVLTGGVPDAGRREADAGALPRSLAGPPVA